LSGRRCLRKGLPQIAPSARYGLPFPLRCSYTDGVADLRFTWDERKNESNKRKHGISFEEAKTVFADDHALLIADPDHSESEDRFLLLGLSAALRTLVVCHALREQGDLIRIISVRKADRLERAAYNRRWIP
jgi:uncharacterized protein